MDIQEALDTLRDGYQPANTAELPPRIQQRLLTSETHARAAAARVSRAETDRVFALLATAASSSTSGKRVLWLQKAAQHLGSTYAPHAACRQGCSHCCHIPVRITHAEALFIGRQIGRRPNAPEQLPPEPDIQGYASPCPFLTNAECSIYLARPMVCRMHLNLDQDALLCELLPDSPVPVPYLDTRLLVMTSIEILGEKQPMADLRQWFATETTV